MTKIIAWWSAGVTSAVATKLAVEEFGAKNVEPIYFHIDTAHQDNERFKKECEEWYGCKINTWTNEKYKDQFEVIQKTRYINGAAGARCSTELKRRVRQRIEKVIPYDHQVFGFEYSKKEINRAIRFKEQYPDAKPLFPLIENKMTKAESLYFLEKEAGIERPFMYKLGYHNNNCVGCVKGGKGYWNKIRQDFPEIFQQMAKAEREIGRSCIKEKFLDELHPEEGAKQQLVMPDCGNFCDIEFTDIMSTKIEKVMEDPKQLRLI